MAVARNLNRTRRGRAVRAGARAGGTQRGGGSNTGFAANLGRLARRAATGGGAGTVNAARGAVRTAASANRRSRGSRGVGSGITGGEG